MAKMQNPPLDVASETLDDGQMNAGGPSSSKTKLKRKRKESVDEVLEGTMIDSSIAGRTSPNKNNKRRKRRKKGPITIDGSAGSPLFGQAAIAGTSAGAQLHELESAVVSTAVNPARSSKGKGKVTKETAKGESSSAKRGDDSKVGLEPLQEVSSGQEATSSRGNSTEASTIGDGRGPESSSALHEKQKAFMASLSQSLLCQICLDPMFRPHTLAPCGHSACFTCLESWFRSPPQELQPADIPNNEFDPLRPEFLALNSATLLRKRKTCPHCRAHVSSKPIEAWNVKSIVASLFANGLGEDLYPGTSLPTPEADAAATERQPWKGIFREEQSVLDRIRAYEHAEMVDADGQPGAPVGELGIRDEEDGVYRCVECLHEIWDGVCSHCEQLYPAHLNFDMDPFDDDDVDILDGELFWGEEGIDHLEPLANGHGDGEGDESDGYESSFIDDDNAGNNSRNVIDLTRELGRNARNGRRPPGASVIDISSSDESDRGANDEDENEETDSDSEEDEDEESDSKSEDEEIEVEEVAVVEPSRRGRRRKGPLITSDDEEEGDNNDSDDEVLQVRRRRNRTIRQPIYVSDDDEDNHHTSNDENDVFIGDEENDGIGYSDDGDY